MNNKYIGIVCMLVLLSGCATMSKEECKQADWYIKGVEDATKGFPLDRVIEHGKACARIKITPDMKEYREGHAKGARLYCVPEKGYSEGRDGAAYNGICPVELEPKFLRAYRDGQELYRIQQNMNRMLNEINGNNSQIDSYYNEISRLKYEIVNSRDENDRRYKMRRIDELEQDIRNLSLNADRAARELELFKNDYRVVEDKHRRMGYL
ncbi:DUF2799 domain-containing protein [Cellvibrio zantedeschiae]|nr:DUF2799 domain-containing protein [Cellvibrio zantedeschiae]